MASAGNARWRPRNISGWGRTSPSECLVARPERMDAFDGAILGGDLIARGGGRSYGDFAVNPHGRVILTERLDCIRSFDPETGAIVVEPGVTFRDLVRTYLPRGFLPPVNPGTGLATIGGAVANDVHGKNHDSAGNFGNHVDWLELLTPAEGLVRVSPQNDPELFAATLGGIGLTGLIRAIAFRLVRVPSNAMSVRRRRASDLDDLMHGLAEGRAKFSHSVAWIDALSRGGRLGRGIIEQADPAMDNAKGAVAAGPKIFFDFPDFALSGPAVRAFNSLYWRQAPRNGCELVVPMPKFLCPLIRSPIGTESTGNGDFGSFTPPCLKARGNEVLKSYLRQSRRRAVHPFWRY